MARCGSFLVFRYEMKLEFEILLAKLLIVKRMSTWAPKLGEAKLPG